MAFPPHSPLQLIAKSLKKEACYEISFVIWVIWRENIQADVDGGFDLFVISSARPSQDLDWWRHCSKAIASTDCSRVLTMASALTTTSWRNTHWRPLRPLLRNTRVFRPPTLHSQLVDTLSLLFQGLRVLSYTRCVRDWVCPSCQPLACWPLQTAFTKLIK